MDVRDCEESWALKNWCFWTVVLEKTLESPLDFKEIQPVHPKGDQSWVFIGRTDAEAETPILWPPHVTSWLPGKDPDARRDWRQEEKGTTEDEMAGWHHRLDAHEFGWTPGVGDGQGGLTCCDSWDHKESDTTEQLHWTKGPSSSEIGLVLEVHTEDTLVIWGLSLLLLCLRVFIWDHDWKGHHQDVVADLVQSHHHIIIWVLWGALGKFPCSITSRSSWGHRRGIAGCALSTGTTLLAAEMVSPSPPGYTAHRPKAREHKWAPAGHSASRWHSLLDFLARVLGALVVVESRRLVATARFFVFVVAVALAVGWAVVLGLPFLHMFCRRRGLSLWKLQLGEIWKKWITLTIGWEKSPSLLPSSPPPSQPCLTVETRSLHSWQVMRP